VSTFVRRIVHKDCAGAVFATSVLREVPCCRGTDWAAPEDKVLNSLYSIIPGAEHANAALPQELNATPWALMSCRASGGKATTDTLPR